MKFQKTNKLTHLPLIFNDINIQNFSQALTFAGYPIFVDANAIVSILVLVELQSR